MIHVLHIGLSSNPGGVENFVLNYHRHIDRNKIQFDYLDMYGDGIAFSNEIVKLGGKIFTISNYKKHPFKSADELNKLLKIQDFDIVHVHMQSAANIMPILIGKRHKNINIICHSHSSNTPSGMVRKILNKLNKTILKRMNVNKWACGKKAGKWMWGDSFDDSNIILNSVEYSQYKYNEDIRKIYREKLFINEKDKIIGFVGRFGEEKNTFFLLEILKELVNMSPDFKLLTVGGNDLYDMFLEKVKENKLEKNYYSAGIQPSAKDWYQVMDAFLLPSYFEGFPMVAVEAQASGLPCFLSNTISNEINITNTITFLPIEKGDNLKWANEIYEKLKKWNRNNNNEFPDEYKIEKAAQALENKYIQILKKYKNQI